MLCVETTPSTPAVNTDEEKRSPQTGDSPPGGVLSGDRGSNSPSISTSEVVEDLVENVTSSLGCPNLNHLHSDDGVSESDEDVVGSGSDELELEQGSLGSLEWSRDVEEHKYSSVDFTDSGGKASMYPGRKLTKALDFFMLLFPVALISKIVVQTNKYARSLIDKVNSRRTNARIMIWNKTDVSEMYNFLGVSIFMSLEPIRGGFRKY